MFLKIATKFYSILRYFYAIKSFHLSNNALLYLDLTNVFLTTNLRNVLCLFCVHMEDRIFTPC